MLARVPRPSCRVCRQRSSVLFTQWLGRSWHSPVWIVEQVIAVYVAYSNSAGRAWANGLGIAWPVTWIDNCSCGGTDKDPSLHRELQQRASKVQLKVKL